MVAFFLSEIHSFHFQLEILKPSTNQCAVDYAKVLWASLDVCG